MLLPIFLFGNRELRHQPHSKNYKGLDLYELFSLLQNISRGKTFILLMEILNGATVVSTANIPTTVILMVFLL
jgi:hypothetical protein